MKDVDQPYQQGLYTALNGNVSYGGNNVPVFVGQADTTSRVYIVLTQGSNVQDNGNKHKFCTAVVMNIDIIDHQSQGVSYKVVDSVYNDIMEILIPSPQSAGFTIAAGFQVVGVEVVGVERFVEPSLDKVVRKIARLRAEIFQNL